jgi:hypothetical protein
MRYHKCTNVIRTYASAASQTEVPEGRHENSPAQARHACRAEAPSEGRSVVLGKRTRKSCFLSSSDGERVGVRGSLDYVSRLTKRCAKPRPRVPQRPDPPEPWKMRPRLERRGLLPRGTDTLRCKACTGPGDDQYWIARLNTYDTLDSFNPDANGAVNAIAIQPADGKILIGGSFTKNRRTDVQADLWYAPDRLQGVWRTLPR